MSDAAVPPDPVVTDVRKPTNRFAIPALIAAVVLCFPVAAVLGALSLIEIRRSRGTQEGALFAGIALLMSLVFAPGVVLTALYGKPRVLDACFHTQENAVGVLRVISYLEQEFKKKHGRYGALNEIGFAPKVDTGPYDYAVEVHEKDHFLATAKGKGPMKGDLLTVDERRQVERAIDRCAAARQR